MEKNLQEIRRDTGEMLRLWQEITEILNGKPTDKIDTGYVVSAHRRYILERILMYLLEGHRVFPIYVDVQRLWPPFRESVVSNGVCDSFVGTRFSVESTRGNQMISRYAVCLREIE